MWIDSHAHPHFLENAIEIIQQALDDEVRHILCVATNLSNYQKLRELKNQFKNIHISLGHHPLEEDDFNSILLKDYVSNDKDIIAIGETGFDFQGDLKKQRNIFDQHVQIAMDFDLPIILHARQGDIIENEVMAALSNWPKLKGVFHCFTGSQKLADFAQKISWKISFSGIITFKNAHKLREIAKNIALESLLIETDSPYLSPEPVRSKNNAPINVKYIGLFIAQLLNIESKRLASIIEKNYFNLFVGSNY